VIVVDTGPLYAVADSDDAHHEACTRVIGELPGPLIVPVSVVIEASFLAGRYLGPQPEAEFLRSLVPSGLVVESLTDADLERTADLVEAHADLRLGAVDASVVAVAEQLEASVIFTIDRRHFSVVRPRHVDVFELVP